MMKSQPVKVGGKVVGRVEAKTEASYGTYYLAYRTLPDGTEQLVGTFGNARPEACRLRAVAAVKQAAGGPGP
jgi:hypothetical protein